MTYLELRPPNKPESDSYDVFIGPAGLGFAFITPEMKRKQREFMEAEKNNSKDNDKSPKPPRGKLVGRIALGF
jgi:hypothetical protein